MGEEGGRRGERKGGGGRREGPTRKVGDKERSLVVLQDDERVVQRELVGVRLQDEERRVERAAENGGWGGGEAKDC